MSEPTENQDHPLSDLPELSLTLGDAAPNLPGITYRCRNDRDWTMLDLPDAVRDLTGYAREELLPGGETTYAELIHPEDRERVRNEVQEAIDAGRSFRTTYRIRTREGDTRWVWEQGRRVEAGAAGPVADELIGFIQDVTGWRAKWERLERDARLLAQTVAGLEEAVLVIDTSGLGRGILSVNPAAERIFGYSGDELIGETTEKLHVSPEAFEAFGAELEPELKAKGVVHASYPMRRKDGTEFAAEQTVTLLDPEEGLSGGAVSVVRDVSEQQALEDQLRRAQRLEAVGRLAGGVAHDFNNLLTVIRAHSDFLVMELPDSEPLLSEVRAIQDAADRAADLTSQLLAFSRDQVLQPRVVDMNEIVRGMERLLGRVIEEPIEVRTELHPEALPIEVDPGRLEHAIMNLAVNARDAMPGGGVLTLTTALETHPLATPGVLDLDDALVHGPRVALSVADTGTGMSDETAARIFEPFFTTKTQGKGTGLGLATTYGFVAQSGGTITVDSELGRGTEFTLRFPVAEGVPESAESSSSAAVDSLGGVTVLVVEDDANVLRVIHKALGRAGCIVRSAETGEAALDILDRERDSLDVVLTDLVLPGVSGLRVVERVLEVDPPIPVLVMSGYAADSTGQTAELPSEAAFLPKPFTPAALVDRVRETLAG